MIHYHDTSRPAPSREHVRCGRPIPGVPGAECREVLWHETHPTQRGTRDICPACDRGWRRTQPITGASCAHGIVGHCESCEEHKRRIQRGMTENQRYVRRPPMSKEEGVAALRNFYLTEGRAPNYRELNEDVTTHRSGMPYRRTLVNQHGSVREAFRVAGIPEAEWPDRGFRTKGRGMVMRRVVP